jgi:hypothetical protein
MMALLKLASMMLPSKAPISAIVGGEVGLEESLFVVMWKFVIELRGAGEVVEGEEEGGTGGLIYLRESR